MKIALIALILGFIVAGDGIAQSVFIQRSTSFRPPPGFVWTTGGFSWRFAAGPARIWRPLGWGSPGCWGSPGVFVGGAWSPIASRSIWTSGWSPSHAVVPDPVVIPTVSLLTETGVRGTP